MAPRPVDELATENPRQLVSSPLIASSMCVQLGHSPYDGWFDLLVREGRHVEDPAPLGTGCPGSHCQLSAYSQALFIVGSYGGT